MEKLVAEIATKLVKLLGLLDVSPNDITPKTPFFDGGLGLDSIDMLEMVFMLDRDYGVLIDNRELGEKVLINFGTLAQYITENRQSTNEGRSE
ncbi:MAG: acyl carrier protein [Proteobacteria bacterium]|nr:acyl carrier protein [Pseudomonadota bacterium]MBU1740068.1 acyl carrier protein [Pseudomonadota bacterium]